MGENCLYLTNPAENAIFGHRYPKFVRASFQRLWDQIVGPPLAKTRSAVAADRKEFFSTDIRIVATVDIDHPQNAPKTPPPIHNPRWSPLYGWL